MLCFVQHLSAAVPALTVGSGLNCDVNDKNECHLHKAGVLGLTNKHAVLFSIPRLAGRAVVFTAHLGQRVTPFLLHPPPESSNAVLLQSPTSAGLPCCSRSWVNTTIAPQVGPKTGPILNPKVGLRVSAGGTLRGSPSERSGRAVAGWRRSQRAAGLVAATTSVSWVHFVSEEPAQHAPSAPFLVLFFFFFSCRASKRQPGRGSLGGSGVLGEPGRAAPILAPLSPSPAIPSGSPQPLQIRALQGLGGGF